MFLEILILALSIPVGFLIAWLARDELVQGRRYFAILFIASVSVSIWFFLTKNYSISLTTLFIASVSLTSYIKSFNKAWTIRKLK